MLGFKSDASAGVCKRPHIVYVAPSFSLEDAIEEAIEYDDLLFENGGDEVPDLEPDDASAQDVVPGRREFDFLDGELSDITDSEGEGNPGSPEGVVSGCREFDFLDGGLSDVTESEAEGGSESYAGVLRSKPVAPGSQGASKSANAPAACPASNPGSTTSTATTLADTSLEAAKPPRKRRRTAVRRLRRRADRERAQEDAGFAVKTHVLRKYLRTENAIRVDFDAENGSHTSTSWTGLCRLEQEREDAKVRQMSGPEALVYLTSKVKMTLYNWDGSTQSPLVDKKERVVGDLVGSVNQEASAGATNIMAKAADAGTFNEGQRKHRRGDFKTLSTGISYGGGQKKPGNLRNLVTNSSILAMLLSDPNIILISGIVNCAFAMYGARLFLYYMATLAALLSMDKSLRRNFPGAFACITFNFGAQAITRLHRDVANLVWGWCSITALGNFDPDRGGHLILWDFGLIIRFPPGSSIIIPSCIVRHSNVPIGPGENRYSMIQYSAGGLFRWAYNGFCGDKQSKTPQWKRQRDKVARWNEGLKMFMTLDELQAVQSRVHSRR